MVQTMGVQGPAVLALRTPTHPFDPPRRFHVHYDEAFSSLQVPHFKGFCRFHITRSGDLEMYSLGLEKV